MNNAFQLIATNPSQSVLPMYGAPENKLKSIAESGSFSVDNQLTVWSMDPSQKLISQTEKEQKTYQDNNDDDDIHWCMN
jgi:streptogramin lyase